MPTYLVDTNVMLAASACHNSCSALLNEAEPKEPELRERVYNWLRDFDLSTDSILLDEDWLIRGEYEHKMAFNSYMREQEYGFQVLQNKQDLGLVNYVPIDVDTTSGEPIAILSEELTAIVTDRADRKWVAAAQSAKILHDLTCPIVYGAESDWYVIQDDLLRFGIHCKQLLPDEWYED